MTTKNQINTTLLAELKRTFVQTIVDLDNPEKIDAFFNNFFTKTEYENFTKRLAIFYWIKKGRNTNNIKQNLKVTNIEIENANKLINSKGIKLAIKHLEAEEWANKWIEKFRKVRPSKI